MEVSAESAVAVASNVFLESLTTRQSVADLMVVLAHLHRACGCHRAPYLQGVAALAAPSSCTTPVREGRGLTHALTHTAPTDLTVAAALVRKAYSKRRRSRLWSTPVNLRTS